MKLNLGSSSSRFSDFTNVDHRKLPNTINDDAFTLMSVSENSVEEIVAAHILEHASYDRTIDILKRWNSLLIPGGILWVAVPSFDLVLSYHLQHYLDGKITWEYFNSRIFGNSSVAKVMYGNEFMSDFIGVPKYEVAYHKAVFTQKMLNECLSRAGFSLVETIDKIPYKKKHGHEICSKAIK